VLSAVGAHDRLDRRTQVVTRVLGARLVLQGVADVVLGTRTRRLDIAVDLLHAASMVPVAAVSRRHRRSTIVSAACAAGIAVLDGFDGRQEAARGGPARRER
jgi:hypothetical protein